MLPVWCGISKEELYDYCPTLLDRVGLVKLLEEGKISFTKVGKHRRIRYEDVINYKKKMKAEQKRLLIEIMKSDEETGLYDT